jgi:hypothetical protein
VEHDQTAVVQQKRASVCAVLILLHQSLIVFLFLKREVKKGKERVERRKRNKKEKENGREETKNYVSKYRIVKGKRGECNTFSTI